MCGLCGVYGHIGKKELGAFSMLSMLSQLRGKDSTGVGLVYHNKKKPSKVLKSIGGMESLAIKYPKEFNASKWVLVQEGLLCVIGHNRWATVGEVNEENAHPFEYEHIIGCHNGTIPHYELNHLDSYDFDKTDSQIIMEELSLDKDAGSIIEYVKGAWALTWFNTKTRQLHMLRNKERTLYCVLATNKKTLFWASESWMLEVTLQYYGVEAGKVESVIPDRHLSWKRKGNGDILLEDVRNAAGGKFLNRNFKFKKYNNNVTPIEPYSDWNFGWEESYTENEETHVETTYNNWVSKGRYEQLVNDGCSMCSGDLTWGDRKEITWENWETPICRDCSQHLEDNKEVLKDVV